MHLLEPRQQHLSSKHAPSYGTCAMDVEQRSEKRDRTARRVRSDCQVSQGQWNGEGAAGSTGCLHRLHGRCSAGQPHELERRKA